MTYDPSPYRSPQSIESLAPPRPGTRPPQWWLFQLYCWLMAGLYLLTTGLGAFLVLFSSELEREEQVDAMIYGVVFLAMSPVLAIVFGVAPLLPPRRWAWIYGVVLIGLGMSSCCTWPISIPLLVIWVKKETQAYFL